MRVPFAAESVAEVRHALDGWLAAHGVGEPVVNDARLVVSELVGNAVRHASPLGENTVLVRWRMEDDLVMLSVCDGGGPTAPARVVASVDDLGGRGLAIVEALCAAWWVERTQHLHAVHVQLPIDRNSG